MIFSEVPEDMQYTALGTLLAVVSYGILQLATNGTIPNGDSFISLARFGLLLGLGVVAIGFFERLSNL